MSRGIGALQSAILRLLLDRGGALAVPGILEGLFDKASIGEKEYRVICSSLSRSLKGLRVRRLVMSYTGIVVAGHHVVVVAITGEGKKVGEGIEWEGAGDD